MNDQSFTIEQPPSGLLTDQERGLIRRAADVRRMRQAVKLGLGVLEVPEQELYKQRHQQQTELVNKMLLSNAQPEVPASTREETQQQITELHEASQESMEYIPNVAALQYARAAELTAALGEDPAEDIALAKQAITASVNIPTHTPAAFFPQAMVVATESRLLQQEAMPIPRVVAQAALHAGKDGQQIIAEYALVLPEKGRVAFLKAFPEPERKKIEAVMDRALSEVLKEGTVVESEEKQQLRAVRKRIDDGLTEALGAGSPDDRTIVKVLNQAAYTLGDKDTADVILGLGQDVLEGGKESSRHIPRLFATLIALNTHKGNSLAIELLGRNELADPYALYFLQQLVKNEYLDSGLLTVLQERAGHGSAQEKVDAEHKFLELVRLIITRLNINPDADVMRLITDDEWKDEQGERLTEPEAIVEKIREQKKRFEKVDDKDQLVQILKSDRRAATIYYVLYGGKTRFALVNSYNSDKFFTAIGKMDALRVHEPTVAKFKQTLIINGVQVDTAEAIIGNLRAGHFPLGGEYAKSIRVDVSDSDRLKSLEAQAAETFGCEQLGVLLKIRAYQQFLEGQGDQKRVQDMAACNGLTDLRAVIADIESQYPQLRRTLQDNPALLSTWKKLGDKEILRLSLPSVLNEQRNAVDLRDLLQKVEVQRKSLVSQYKQQTKEFLRKLSDPAVREEEKKKIIDQVQMIEEKGASKLFAYIVSETMAASVDAGREGLDPKLSELETMALAEWESHIAQIFGEYQAIDPKALAKTSQRNISLRFLDKRNDLVECARFADSAQCCFNSTQYGGPRTPRGCGRLDCPCKQRSAFIRIPDRRWRTASRAPQRRWIRIWNVRRREWQTRDTVKWSLYAGQN